MDSKYRVLIPNAITFLSLACGTSAILLATRGQLLWAGVLVLASFILDMLDGASARKLQAGTDFGLQLDSLVDMVSLGTAPAVIAFMHLQNSGVSPLLIWPSVLTLPLAGAFRLARFNLQPPKETGNVDSVGLPISTAGASVALAVLTDLFWPDRFIAEFVLIPLLWIMAVFMVSKIAFPSLYAILAAPRRRVVLILLFVLSTITMPLFYAWFMWTNAYVGFSVALAGANKKRPNARARLGL